MTAPTTLPDALAIIEELRGQVRDLLQLREQDAKPSHAGVSASSVKAMDAYEFSEGLIPKQTGKAASQHLRDLHQVIETVPDVIFKLDLQGNLAGWNKRLAIVTGFTSQELNGRPALSFVPEHEHAQTAAAIQRAFEDGYAELEGHMLTKAQLTIPYHWTGAALKNEEGRVIGITGVGRDVSEKRRIQAELKRQRQQLLSAHALAHVGSWEWDIASGDMEWSEEQFRIFGHEPGTIPTTYETILAAVLPDDRDRVFTTIETALKERETLDVECRIVRPNGEIRNIHCRGEIVPDHEGHPARMACSTLDITNRKQAELSLQQSEAHFRALIEHSSDIITVLNLDGTIRFESPSFERLLGYQQHEIDGRIAFDFVHQDDLPTVLEKFQQVVQRPGESQTAMFRFRHKDGSWLPLEGIGRSILDADGQCLVIVNSRDVTERKRAENALSRSYDLLKSFVEHTPAAVAMLDQDLRYIAVSRRWYQDYRLGNQDLIGRHHYDVFPEIRSIMEWQAIHQRCLSGAVERREEDRFVRADGSEDWLRWEVRPWHDETGHIGGLIMFTEVITERKRAKEALRLSEERYARATAIGKVGVWELDAVTGLYHGDVNLKALFGYEPDELSTDPYVWLGLVHPADQAIALKAWEGVVSGSMDDYHYELRMIRKDGTIIWTEVRGHSERDERGHVQRLIGATVDITERKQADMALRISQMKLQQALEASTTGLWEWNTTTNEVAFSPEWKRQLGYEDAELPNTFASWESRLHPDDRTRAVAYAVQYRENPIGTFRQDFRLRHKDGTYRWIESQASFVTEADGRRARLLGSHTDITELKRVEDALAQRSHQQQVVAEFGEFALRERELQRVLDQAVQRIAQTLDAKYCKVLELQQGGTSLLLKAGVGWHDGLVGRATVSAELESQAGYTLSSNEAVIVENLETDRRFSGPPLLFEHGVVSGLSVIIRGEHQPWGVLGVHTSTRRTFTKDDINFVQSMANILCSFIERSAVEETLAHRERQLRTMLDALPIGIWFTDQQGCVHYGNPVGQQIWSGAVKVGLPDHNHDIRHWENIEATNLPHRWAIGSALIKNQPVLNEMIEIEVADGSRRTIRNSAVQVRNHTGTLQGAIVLNEDITERKQAEAALLESEERFRTLVWNIPGAIYRRAVDSEWTMSYLSHAIEEIVGYPAAEFIGNHIRSYASVIHPDDRRLVKEATWASLRERRPYVLEYRLIHANGDVRWVYEKGQGVFTPDGEARFFDGAIFDITERKQAEELLRLTQFSVDRAVDGVFWVAPDGRILSVNEAACRMLEYSREELTAMTVYDIDPQFSPESWSAHWENLKQKESMTFESKHWSRTGGVLETEVTVNYLQYEGREYNCAIMRDIGDRKRAERALHESEERYRKLYDDTPTMYFKLATDGTVRSVNHYGAEQLGYRVKDLVGHSVLGVFHEADKETVATSLSECLATPETTKHWEFRKVRKDGTVIWVRETARVVQSSTGETVVLVTCEDITERKCVEAELRQREQDLRRAGEERERISEDLHDGILQSIYAIGLGLEACKPLIAEQPKRSSVKLKSELHRTVGQLNYVMEDVRNFIAGLNSRILDGQEFDTVLQTMVHGLAASYSIPCRVTIEKAAAQSLSTEQAYHVINVAREALSNSLRHSHANKIGLSLKGLRRSVRLSVTDNGVGFKPSAVRGTGHGLANMESRASKIGGTVILRSKPRGGTKIILDLPIIR